MGSDCRASTGLGGNRDFILKGHKQNLVHNRTQGIWAVTPQEPESNLLVSVGRSPAEVWVGSGSPRGQWHWQQQSWEVPLGMSPCGICHYHRACRLQSWITSGQTTNRKETQPHPLADNWILVLLSKALPTRPRPKFSHCLSLPWEACISLLVSTFRGQTEETKTIIHSLQNEKHNHRNLIKIKKAEDYVPDKGTR